MSTEEKQSRSVLAAPLREYFCEKGGHDLRTITDSLNKQICQTCRGYFLVDETGQIVKEITQEEFYR